MLSSSTPDATSLSVGSGSISTSILVAVMVLYSTPCATSLGVGSYSISSSTLQAESGSPSSPGVGVLLPAESTRLALGQGLPAPSLGDRRGNLSSGKIVLTKILSHFEFFSSPNLIYFFTILCLSQFDFFHDLIFVNNLVLKLCDFCHNLNVVNIFFL